MNEKSKCNILVLSINAIVTIITNDFPIDSRLVVCETRFGC